MTCSVVALPQSAQAGQGTPRTGTWRAWLDSPGGELPFGLMLALEGVHWRAWLINGKERIEVPKVQWNSRELILDIDYYDSTITATASANGSRLDGEWHKCTGLRAWTRMPFHATFGKARRFRGSSAPAAPGGEPGVDGRWSVRFSSSDGPAIGVFETRSRGVVYGTFLTTTGDYRYLEGDFQAGRLRLSCFDGAHAFLFGARLQPDGILKGDFWSRDAWHETWTARRDPEAALPDSFTLTKWSGNARLGDLTFPDLNGTPRSVNDPAFVGKARIIEIFGTWCPNCRDASRLLVELDRRYGPRGLKILALAFELTGDFSRDAAQVRTYVKRLDIKYPVLIAGVSKKEKVETALPILDRFRSYPTTIFADARGEIRAVHTGFSGPATGDAYHELRSRFERLIEELLTAEPP